jgi:mycothiol system anti-sigma-R factor
MESQPAREGDQEHGAGVDCEEAVARLYHYLDGELTEERRRLIAAHLDECAPCGRAYGFEAELRQVIADRCRDHVPESLVERVRRALEAEEARSSTKPSG